MIGNDLINKRIIVFGGSGQIGFELVKFLDRNNVNVIVADIDKENFCRKMQGYKSKLRFFQCDVTLENDIIKVFDFANSLGGYHGVVNCIHFKGNTQKLDPNNSFFKSFLEYSEEDWNQVHDVNLKGTFLINRIAIKLKNNRNLSIVNVSSTYGIVSPDPSIYGNSGINSPIAYASSKSAIINLSKYLAVHASDGGNVRVNVISPGGVYNNQSVEFVENYTRKTVLGRMARSEDFIGGFVFLLSDASSYCTGANLVIDGGWTIW